MKTNNQKGMAVLEIIAIIALVVISGIYVVSNVKKGPSEVFTPDPQLIGGDRDAHGCIPSAGYLWSDAKQACVRPWEENQATSTATTTDDGIVCTMEAKLCSDGSYVSRSGPKCEFKACPVSTTTPSITNLPTQTN